MQYYQWQNIIPFAASLISFYLWLTHFNVYGMLINFFGLIIWWAGKIELGDAFSLLPRAKKIVTTGIYSKVKHPIYLSISLVSIGWSFLTQSLIVIILSAVIILSSVIRAYLEEEKLIQEFEADYKKYKKKKIF